MTELSTVMDSTMSTSDWSKVETLTHSSINENDLFGGDLFGDELMDIYTSGGVLSGMEKDLEEIPTLALPSESAEPEETEKAIHEVVLTPALHPVEDVPSLQPLSAPLKREIIHISHSLAATNEMKVEANTALSTNDISQYGPSPITLKLLQKSLHTSDNGTVNPLISFVGGQSITKPVTPTPERPELIQLAPPITPTVIPSDITVLSNEIIKTPIPVLPPSSPESSMSDNQTLDEDFTAVAHAAVSNLILTAGSQLSQSIQGLTHNVHQDNDSDSITSKLPLSHAPGTTDISTERVKALTSPNWVAACNSLNSSDQDTYQPVVKRRRQNLTADERAKQNRVRNREHARNTRLRKKAYVEELKRALLELVTQRDAAYMEKKLGTQRDLEQREVRFRVMEEFLKLRGSNEPNVSRWVAILEDGFSFSLPSTPYRAMVKKTGLSTVNNPLQRPVDGNINGVVQTLHGATEVMADASSVANLLEKISGNKMYMSFDCNREKFIMDGCNAVLDWNATTVAAGNQATAPKLNFKGTMRATFSPASNKLMSTELLFDTGAVIAQLKHVFVLARKSVVDQQINAACHVPLVVLSAKPVPSPVPAPISVCSQSEKSDSSSDEYECNDH